MRIHTIGDSHSMYGWRYIPGVVVHHIGPKLCYSIGRDGLTLDDSYGLETGDIVVFSFGEIDCRCHIHKYVGEGKSYQNIIDDIVEAYISRVCALALSIPTIRFCIYNVVPAVERSTTCENSEYPFLGTDEERKAYTRYFNACLRVECAANKLTFIDVHDLYSDERGFINHKYSDGHVHINNPLFITTFIYNNVLQI
jgi:hypothetical protein